MAQFDADENTSSRSMRRTTYVLQLQHDLLTPALPTCIVAPLVREGFFEPVDRLNPSFAIRGETVVLSIAELASVKREILSPHVLCLQERRDDIVAAVDLLFLEI